MKKQNKNRWHILDHSHNAGHIEWKYFNFTTPGLSGIFVYSATGPFNASGSGEGKVISAIFNGDKIWNKVEKFPASKIMLSNKDSAAKMGDNIISEDGNGCKIRGKIGNLEWNLKYSPVLPAIKSFSNLGIDPLGLERASWLIKMPKARVTGVIKFNKGSFKINSYGYSDANWGNFNPLVTKFNWAQYNDKNVSLVMGEFENFEIGQKKFGRWGRVYVTYGNRPILFKEKDFTIRHVKWKTIPGDEIKIPSTSFVEAENKNYKMSLILETINSDPIRYNMPFFIPIKPVVVEQRALFQGNLFRKKNEKLHPLCFFEGAGFKEYTLRQMSLGNKFKMGVMA